MFSASWLIHGFRAYTYYEANAIAHHIFNENYQSRFGGGVIPYKDFVPFEIVKTCVVNPYQSFDGFIENDILVRNIYGTHSARDYYGGLYSILFYSSDKQMAVFHFDEKLYEVNARFECSLSDQVEISFQNSFEPKIYVRDLSKQ